MANRSGAKHLPAAGSPSTRRAYAVYDGRMRLGTFIWNERTQQAIAWDALRKFVGRFGSYSAAARAIGQAAKHRGPAKMQSIAWESAPCG
jgi:hypothetical protein